MSDLAAPLSPALPPPESPSRRRGSSDQNRRFADLRSVEWRVNLGILPSSPSSSIDDLRRVTAESRRGYARLRRRLLVDPHVFKEGSNSPNLVIDNPLSQSPDSTWSRFFQNAELEKMVDQDLSRLYPEHGSYFQTPGCQGMLRRVLLLWCLRNPEYGYRQGMHELLAPLLYVLHVDIQRLAEVKKLYEDQFIDKFDELSFDEVDHRYHFDFERFTTREGGAGSHGSSKVKIRSIDELDPEIQKIVLLSDAYGAEGELGVVLSDKFMEHDAFSMFDALLSGGTTGVIAMADFFSHSPLEGGRAGMPPVIDASAALYHLLSTVDSSLYSHLIELGVEPQYFALRWFRVLFGREFALRNLLVIWDEIFMSENSKLMSDKSTEDDSFKLLGSHRGAFIAAIAVSMILYLRSSLLATEYATSCLQRLLNFPEGVDLDKLMVKAKSLQVLALDTSTMRSSEAKPRVVRSHVSGSVSPNTPKSLVPDSYWEEKWRDLHVEEELKQSSSSGKGGAPSTKKKRWSDRLRLSFSRTESDRSPSKAASGSAYQEVNSPARRSLLEDLSQQQQLGHEESSVEKEENNDKEKDNDKDHRCSVEVESERQGDERSYSGIITGSEENSSIFSDLPSPPSGVTDHENETEKSSICSNVSTDENGDSSPFSSGGGGGEGDSSLSAKPMTSGSKEKKQYSGKFPWFWKRNSSGPNETVVSDKGGGGGGGGGTNEADSGRENSFGSVGSDGLCNHTPGSSSSKEDAADENVVMGTLKNLGHSMLDHIQVIESVVFQQDRVQGGSVESLSKSVLVGKGQVTAMAALKELRKISNLLFEM